MGLDMYLNRRISGYKKQDGTISYDIDDYHRDEQGRNNQVTIETEVAYWRKANMIHHWFIKNACGGVDDCRPVWVSLGKIKTLLGLCKQVIDAVRGKTLSLSECVRENFAKSNPDMPTSHVISNVQSYEELYNEISPLWEFEMDEDTSDKCAALLPTQGGFFFGDTSYGASYLLDVIDTAAKLERVIKEDEECKANGMAPEYCYEASW